MKVSDIFKNPSIHSLEKQAAFTSSRKTTDIDGGQSANAELLKGIYYGTAQNFALGSFLAQNFVNIPSAFIGFPIIEGIEDDAFLTYFRDEWPLIKRAALVFGTAWRWARWDANKGTCILESINDENITSIQLDIDTQDIKEIIATENIRSWSRDANIETTERIRRWNSNEYEVTINGKADLRDNMFGALPVPYAHDCWDGEWRGHSVFSRVLRNIRSLHEVMYKREEILSQFTPKLVLKLGDMSSDKFRQANNLNKENSMMDPYKMDMVVLTGTADCSFLAPGDLTTAHTACIDDIQKKVIMGSGLPELFFGGLSTGTEAASDGQVRIALNYIKAKQSELLPALTRQMKDVAKILRFMGHSADPDRVKVSFGSIDITTEESKQSVQSGFVDMLTSLKDGEMVSPKLVQYFGTQLFSDWPYKNGIEAIDDIMGKADEKPAEGANLDAVVDEGQSDSGGEAPPAE